MNQRDYINDLNERYPGPGMLTMNQLMEYTQLCRPACTDIMREYGQKYGEKRGKWLISKPDFAKALANNKR